jgi:transposase
MGIAYSYDLRIRAINLINSGTKINKVAKLLDIGRSTLHTWLAQSRKGLDIKPKTSWQRGYGHKITDLEKFKEFVDKNSDSTITELAEKWGMAKRSTIYRALKKIGYSKKKDLRCRRKE